MKVAPLIVRARDLVAGLEPPASLVRKSTTKPHIFIIDPVHGERVRPKAKVNIERLSPIPRKARTFLRVVSDDGSVARYAVPRADTFELSSKIRPGRHTIQVISVGAATKWVSQQVDIIVDPDAVLETETGERIYCAAPWVQMNVGKANASPCCNFKRKFRNPYRDDAEDYDPWNSKTMQSVRTALVKGDTRYCYSGCGALTHSQAAGLGRLHSANANQSAIDSYLRGDITLDHGASRIKITANHFCNHACLFCSRDIRSSWKANDAIFNLLRQHIDDVKIVALTGGEPLVFLDEVGDKLAEVANSLNGKSLEITTNGSLIAKCIDFLSLPDDLIMNISLNAGTRETYKIVHRKDHFEKVISGIRLLQERRKNKKLFVRLKLVLMKQNRFDVPAYVELAKSLKVDHVKFTAALLYEKADMTANDQLRQGTEEWDETERELKSAVAALKASGIHAAFYGPSWKRDDSDPLELLDAD